MRYSTGQPLSLRDAQLGVGLVEVLISVLVLSFGMLGLVSLQLFTLKNNQSSLERGMAVVQSHSIIDAMRADRTTAIDGGFDAVAGQALPSGSAFAHTALTAWRSNLVAVLGDGATGGVDCNGALCTITVIWNDERAGGSASQTIATQVQL